MQKVIFLLLTATILFTISCKKEIDRNHNVFGQILEYGTNVPIENAIVNLSSCQTSNSLTSCQLEKTVLTNENGSYSMPFTSGTGRSWVLTVEADKYYDSTEIILNPCCDNEKEVILDPHAWLNLHIKNVNPFNQADKITCVGVISPFGTSIIDFIGNDIDTSYINKLVGNKERPIIYSITKNGEETIIKDTLLVSAHDTLNYEILY